MLDSLVQLLMRTFDVVAAVTDGTAAGRRGEQLEPDLLVLDVAIPGSTASGRRPYQGTGVAGHGRLRHQPCADREFVQESLALGDVGLWSRIVLVADLSRPSARPGRTDLRLTERLQR
jgi:CheY-like chemotaxis protein